MLGTPVADHLPMQNREKMCASTSSVRAPARDLLERRARVLQIGEHEFLRTAIRPSASAASRARVSASCARSHQRDVPHVGDRRPIAQQVDVERSRRSARAARRARRRSSPTTCDGVTPATGSTAHARRQIDSCSTRQALCCRVSRESRARSSRASSGCDRRRTTSTRSATSTAPPRSRARLRLRPRRSCRAGRPCRRA